LIYQEKAPIKLTLRFKDFDGDQFTPTTVKYSVIDMDSETVLVAPTTITPANPLTLALDGTVVNKITGSGRRERRQLIVTLDEGLSTAGNLYEDWVVQNRPGVT